MKNLKILTLAAGILSPVFLVGQTFNTVDLSLGDDFFDLTFGMESDSQELFVPEGDPDGYNEIAFTYSPPTPVPGVLPYATPPGGSWWTEGEPGGPPAGSLYFKEISPNKNNFFLAGDGAFDIGYFGNESSDLSRLYMAVNPGKLDEEDLFLYDAAAGGDDAPQAKTVSNNLSDTVNFKFWHDDETKNIDLPQSDELKFRMFQRFDENEQDFVVGEYVFAIGDRAGSLDADYDDGFFYVTGDISPVPEPSQIALLGVLGLGGFLYLRRRRASRK